MMHYKHVGLLPIAPPKNGRQVGRVLLTDDQWRRLLLLFRLVFVRPEDRLVCLLFVV